jgi:hypothetical protein
MSRVSMAQGEWSTAQLSVARYYLAATSVGNVAIFAGGLMLGDFLISLAWRRVDVYLFFFAWMMRA